MPCMNPWALPRLIFSSHGSRNGNSPIKRKSLPMNPQDEIRSLLQTFQDGYTHREVNQVDSFMELFSPGAEVIGTNGVKPGMDEWYRDRASARELVQGDWE